MVYLVRHGQPDQSERLEKVYRGFGIHLCPLTALGREQIENTARDPRLRGADLILTSPYTRALETGAILSRALGAPILVETDLHEWLPDKSYRFPDDETIARNYRDFVEHNGLWPEGEERHWESRPMMVARLKKVLEKYSQYHKIIVACHGMLINAAVPGPFPEHGQVLSYDLEKNAEEVCRLQTGEALL